jgi:lysophospholipase L1-like esterase
MGVNMLFEKNTKLVMIGDSITDTGRTRPIAEGLFDPLGKGYVTMVEALILSGYPDLGMRIVNTGCSGDQVTSLKKRWQTDVLDLKPDYVSVMIGTNDVWRQFDMPRQKEAHVLPDVYEATYRELIEQTKPRVKQMILMTPFYLEPNKKDAMRARMDEYGVIVKKLAKKYDTVFVDTQARFDGMLKHMHSAAIGWDRVHPNQAGHMAIARAFLDGVGFKW